MARRYSAAVYRRRRLFVFVVLGLVIVGAALGVWAAVAQPWSGSEEKPTPTTSETPSAETPPVEDPGTESPAPTVDETPTGPTPCQAADIEVVAVTDADTYAAGVLPKLSIALTNKGTTDCTNDVGTATQSITVTSGADVWWRSTDCQQNPGSQVVTLTAGQTAASATPVEWDRTRSSVDTCAQENRPRAAGGGASYHVTASIGGFTGEGSKQILLY